jgi:hypothetical protein
VVQHLSSEHYNQPDSKNLRGQVRNVHITISSKDRTVETIVIINMPHKKSSFVYISNFAKSSKFPLARRLRHQRDHRRTGSGERRECGASVREN